MWTVDYSSIYRNMCETKTMEGGWEWYMYTQFYTDQDKEVIHDQLKHEILGIL